MDEDPGSWGEMWGTGTQNSCQPARAHQCWSAPGGGWNMEMSPGDRRDCIVWITVGGLVRDWVYPLSRFAPTRMSDCQMWGTRLLVITVQSAVKCRWRNKTLTECLWTTISSSWGMLEGYQLIRSQSHGPMNIRICIGDKILRQNISKACTC